MARKKRGRSVKKNKNSQGEIEEVVTAPHSIVIHKGLPGGHVLDLTKDFRKVMEPFTASSLKERKKNTLKDFVHISGLFHVSHLSIFSRTELGVYMKLSRLPRGPTLTFKVHNFSLARDVISNLKKQVVIEEAFKHSPLIILNGFSGEGLHFKLMASMFQNMFPSINLTKVDLNTVRRCVLLNYNASTQTIDFRHFNIKVAPVGISKGVKKVIQGKVPNLARFDEISDFLEKGTLLSESEAEDDPNSHVTLSQKIKARGNLESGKSAIRLSELGPRMTMQLIKIEDGLMDGEVLYHNNIEKTDEEKLEIQKRRELKKKLKEKRKKIQEQNKKAKEDIKTEMKEKSLKGMEKNKPERSETDKLLRKSAAESNRETMIEEDDDAAYYREEVGEEPEKELFSSRPSGMKRPPKTFHSYKSKKPRMDEKSSGGRFGDKNDKFSRNSNNKFSRNKDDSFSRGKNDKFSRNKNDKFSKNRDDSFSRGKPNKFSRNKNDKFSRNKNDKFSKNKRGGRVDKTNSDKRDFRPIGGGNTVKKGIRKFGKNRK